MPDDNTEVRPTFTIRVTLAVGNKTIADVGQDHITMLNALTAAESIGKRLAVMVACNLLADVLPDDYVSEASLSS